MSTPTEVANAQLAKFLKDNEDRVLSVIKSKPVDLSEEMFQRCLISDSMMDQFSSLDHSKVDHKLQLRYLLRLVAQRIQQDGSGWGKFLSLLESWGEQSLSEYLRSGSGKEQTTEAERKCIKDTLCSEDLRWILETLVTVSHDWEMIGTALDLKPYQIKNSEVDNNVKSLRKVLLVWLSGGCATVSTLTQALRSELVGHGRVAQEIEKKFTSILESQSIPGSSRPDESKLDFTITHQNPRKVEVEDGKSILLLVQASQKENVSYQWNKDNQPLADSQWFSGIHDGILTINHAHQGTGGEYTCCVRSQEREIVSNKVTLTVLHPVAKKTLLDLYSVNTRVLQDEEWPPVGTETFINLVLNKCNTQNTKTSQDYLGRKNTQIPEPNFTIEYEKLFGSYKSAALILVEGHPGSGKTTLVNKIIKDWTKGKSLVNTKLVFLVSLRMLGDDILQEATLTSILKYFYNSDEDLRAVLSEIEKFNGEGVCFVFDGLDEYNPKEENKSVVFKLLHKQYLPRSMIIVSSRRGATRRLKQHVITQHIEVSGFTQQQIVQYIDNFPFDFSSDSPHGPAHLKEYLELHPNVFHMCYLPIHAAIICFVYMTERGQLSNTQTKIYEEFARSMILRYLQRNEREIEIHSLNELPEDIQENFNNLCSLAFNMIVSNKQVVDARQIDFSSDKDTSLHGDWSLGLVSCNRTAQLSGISTSYMFLHLTLQEFLAAFYVTNAEEEQKRKIIEKLPCYPYYNAAFQNHSLMTFWKFYFGLETFKSADIPHLINGSVIELAFESQKPRVCEQIIKYRNGRLSQFNIPSHQVPALIYTICTSPQHIVELTLAFQRDIDMDHVFQQIYQQKIKYLQQLLLLTPITNQKTLKYFLYVLKSCALIKQIQFSLRGLTAEGSEYLIDGLRCLDDSVDLTIVYTSSTGISNFIKAIVHFNGKNLSIRFKDLTSNGVQELASCLQFFTDKNMNKMTIKCRHSAEGSGLVAVINKIHCLNRLKSLVLTDNRINDTCCKALTTNISTCHLDLEDLDLGNNNISSDSAIILASELHHLKNLRQLSLSDNNIDAEGAIQVIAALKDCQKLTRVELYDTFYLYSILQYHKSPGFHLEGTVSHEDTATVESLVAAVRLHRRDADVHLGGDTSSGYRIIHVSWNTEQSEDNSDTTSTLCSCRYDTSLTPIIHY